MEHTPAMKKFTTVFLAILGAALIAPDASAQVTLMLAENIGGGLAAGLGVVGAGIGIGLIGAHSNDAVARQPEMAGRIFTNMILTAALVEGVALFAVVVGGFVLK